MTVNLVSIREVPDSTALLYELMAQRPKLEMPR